MTNFDANAFSDSIDKLYQLSGQMATHALTARNLLLNLESYLVEIGVGAKKVYASENLPSLFWGKTPVSGGRAKLHLCEQEDGEGIELVYTRIDNMTNYEVLSVVSQIPKLLEKIQVNVERDLKLAGNVKEKEKYIYDMLMIIAAKISNHNSNVISPPFSDVFRTATGKQKWAGK